jgi:catechol 2,3-dioxygenase-like lactoylglutathione lyase family enzyme
MPDTTFPGIGHVALTVSDLQRSVTWYRRLFDAEPVLDEDTGPYHHVVWMLGGTLLGLHQHARAASTEPADGLRPGLDHVAFNCSDRDALENWAERLDELGIPHGPIVDAPYGSGLSFRDPDNIPLEFFAPPS